jgi:hypothetical protein
MSVPLRNRKNEIIAYAMVSDEDLANVNKYTWHRIHKNHKDPNFKNIYYVQGKVDGKNILLHQFILGMPEENMVIDHINGDGLNNHRDNLRFATKSQNSQNSETPKSLNKTSKYIGVSLSKEIYRVNCRPYHLGSFKDENEAGIKYDICAYLIHGEYAKTNNLITYIEALKYKLEDLIVKRKERNLPKGIYTINGEYYTEITYKEFKNRSKNYKNIQDAIQCYELFLEQIHIIKQNELEEHMRLTIIRNENGLAIIKIYNKNKDLVNEVLVDDDLWHKLTLYTWWNAENNYTVSKINNKNITMHNYIYLLNNPEIPQGYIIDHINKITNDNRRSNLRLNTKTGNSHNRIKVTTASSKYYGVYKKDKKWMATIQKDGISHYLGSFNLEIEAAKAYNIKAKELYLEFANLNIFDE